MLNNIWANLTMSIGICLCCNICWVTLDRASSFASWKAARIFLEYKSQTILFWFASFANDSTPCNETLACKNRAGYFALCLEIYIVWAMNQSVNPSIHNPYPYISFLYYYLLCTVVAMEKMVMRKLALDFCNFLFTVKNHLSLHAAMGILQTATKSTIHRRQHCPTGCWWPSLGTLPRFALWVFSSSLSAYATWKCSSNM